MRPPISLFPAPLSTTDREHLSAARRILAIAARDASERAGSSMGGPDDLARAKGRSEAALAIDELLSERGAR